MTPEFLVGIYFELALQMLPVVVLVASGRRLVLSRSGNSVLYAIVFAFAATAAVGVAPGFMPGHPVSFGAAVMAFASLPLWLIVREHCRRPEEMPYQRTVRPVFSTQRFRDTPPPLLLTESMSCA